MIDNEAKRAVPGDSGSRRRLSMHEGIASWCDCCSCEAEPYWVEVAEELGIDLGSDYEDAPPTTPRAR
jgi:hypothetical protein